MAEYETLSRRGQGLSEALDLVAKLEAKMLASQEWEEADAQEIRSLLSRIEFLSVRFKPELGFIESFLAKSTGLLDRIDAGETPVREDMVALAEVSAELESEIRQTNSRLYLLDRWVLKDETDLALEVAQLTASLGEVIGLFAHSNSLRANPKMDEVFRKTVIQLLTAAVEELKAPAVNAGKLNALASTLRRIGRKSAERKVGEAAEELIETAAKKAGEVGNQLAELPELPGLF